MKAVMNVVEGVGHVLLSEVRDQRILVPEIRGDLNENLPAILSMPSGPASREPVMLGPNGHP